MKEREVKETKESGSLFLFDKMSFCMVGKRHIKIFISKIYTNRHTLSIPPLFVLLHTFTSLTRGDGNIRRVGEERGQQG